MTGVQGLSDTFRRMRLRDSNEFYVFSIAPGVSRRLLHPLFHLRQALRHRVCHALPIRISSDLILRGIGQPPSPNAARRPTYIR